MSDTGKTGFTLRKNLIKALQSYFLCSIALCSSSAFSAIVTIDVVGKGIVPVFDGTTQINEAVEFTGYFQVDTTAPDSNPDSSQGVYQNAVVSSQLNFTALSDGYTFSATGNANNASELILNPGVYNVILTQLTEANFILQTDLLVNYKNNLTSLFFGWDYFMLAPAGVSGVNQGSLANIPPELQSDIETDALDELIDPNFFNSMNFSYTESLNPSDPTNPFTNVLRIYNSYLGSGNIGWSTLCTSSDGGETCLTQLEVVGGTQFVVGSGGISYATNSVSPVPVPPSFAFMLTALGLVFYKKRISITGQE